MRLSQYECTRVLQDERFHYSCNKNMLGEQAVTLSIHGVGF